MSRKAPNSSFPPRPAVCAPAVGAPAVYGSFGFRVTVTIPYVVSDSTDTIEAGAA